MQTHLPAPCRATLAALALALPISGHADPATQGGVIYMHSDQGIVVVDATTRSTIDMIGGTDNVHGLAITPDGRRLLAGSLVARTPDEAMPRPDAVSASDHEAHHKASPAGEPTLGTLYEIDTERRVVTRRIDVPGMIHHTLVTPDGAYAVSTHPGLGGVSVVALDHGKLRTVLPTGMAPDYAVVNGDGSRVYVSNSGSGTVTEIATADWQLRRQFAVGGAPGHLALAADDQTLYVVDVTGQAVVALDLESGTTTTRFDAGRSPHGIDRTDDGRTLLVSSIEDGQLRAIDIGSGEQRLLSLAPAPYHVSAIRDSGLFYVSSKRKPQVWVIDPRELKVLETISTPGITHQMVSALK